MKHLTTTAIGAVLSLSFVGEALATEWNASLWGSAPRLHRARREAGRTGGARSPAASSPSTSATAACRTTRENLDGISIGAFEMAQFCAGYHPDKNRADHRAGAAVPGCRQSRRRGRGQPRVYDHPAVAEEMAQWNARMLMTSPMPQYNLVGTGEPRDELAEFEGMRVRATGGLGEAFERGGRCADLRHRLGSLPGDGIRRGRHRGLRAARASVLRHHQRGRLVDREPEPRHGELPGGGEHRRLRGAVRRASRDPRRVGGRGDRPSTSRTTASCWRAGTAVLEERGVDPRRSSTDDATSPSFWPRQAAPDSRDAWIEEMERRGPARAGALRSRR
jgi:hypothetical protein